METANGTAPNCESDNPVGAALLLVIGEPVTDDHKNLILGEVAKGKNDKICKFLAQILN